MYEKLKITFVIVLVLITCAVVMTGSAAGSQGQETIEGLSVEVSDHEQSEILDEIVDSNLPGLDLKENAFVFFVDGEEHIVLTDGETQTGTATVSGQVYDLGDESPIIVADSVSFDTKGDRVSIEDVAEEPQNYEYRHIRVDAYTNQIAFAGESAGIRQPISYAALSADKQSAQTANVGSHSRFATVQLSSDELGSDSPTGDVESVFGDPTDAIAVEDRTSGSFWLDSQATIDIVVLGGYSPQMYVADISAASEHRVTADELSSNGGKYAGEVVTVQADAVGTATSSKDHLTNVAPCGDDAVAVGATPPGCVPIVTDATMHSGVFFNSGPGSHNDVVPYAGVSNIDTDAATVPEQGEYEVTGKVVSTSEIDSSLPDGYGLVVYERERTGDLSTTKDVANTASAYSDEITESLQNQLASEEHDGDLSQAVSSNADSTSDGGFDNGADRSSDIEITERGFAVQNTTVGDNAIVEVELTNRGDVSGQKTVELTLSSSTVVDSKSVTVPSGESKTIQLTYSRSSPGSNRLYVNGDDIGMAGFGEKYIENEGVKDQNGDDDGSNDQEPGSSSEGATSQSSDDEGLIGGISDIWIAISSILLFSAGLVLTILPTVAEIDRVLTDRTYNRKWINWTFWSGLVVFISGCLSTGTLFDSNLLVLIGLVTGMVLIVCAAFWSVWGISKAIFEE